MIGVSTDLQTLHIQYNEVVQDFNEQKSRLQDALEFEDIEMLSSYDLIHLKELSLQKRILFWSIKEVETRNQIEDMQKEYPTENYPIEYWQLCIKCYEYYENRLKAEAIRDNKEWNFNRYHKPMINHQLMRFESRINSIKRWGIA